MGLRQALEGLEQRWRDRGMPVDELLRPGLSSDDIREAVQTIGDPSADLLTWYGWHNGSGPLGSGPGLCAAPSGRDLSSLDEAIEMRQWILELEAMVDQDLGAMERFRATCLPIATTRDAGESSIAVDLVTGKVYRRDNVPTSDRFPQMNLLIADDLEVLVRMWCAELDRGRYVWDSEDRLWRYDTADQPADLHERNVIH